MRFDSSTVLALVAMQTIVQRSSRLGARALTSRLPSSFVSTLRGQQIRTPGGGRFLPYHGRSFAAEATVDADLDSALDEILGDEGKKKETRSIKINKVDLKDSDDTEVGKMRMRNC